MSIVQSSEPRLDISGFQFKLLTRLKVFERQDGLFTSSTSLLSSASKYGLLFVGCPSGFQVIVSSTVIGCVPDTKDGATSYHRRTIPLPSQPSHIGLGCDQNYLIVAFRKSGCAHALVYNVVSFTSQNELVVNEVRLSASPEVKTVDLSWNPGIANMMASCMSDGSVTVYEFQPSGVNINSIPPESRSTCVSWSPKGKQLVIGSDEGMLTQYKPDMKAVKTLPGPQLQGKQFAVVNLFWISNFQFAAVFRDKINQQEAQALMIVNAPKGGPMTFVNFDDACYSTGHLRPPQFYFSHLQQWNMLFVGSGNSVEIGVLSLEANQSSWIQWLFDDGARAELPLTSDTSETFLVGMGIDTSTTYKLPWGENSSESIGPMPVLLLLSHYGVLSVYYMVNLLQGYPAICTPPEQPPDLSGLNHFVPGSAAVQSPVPQAPVAVPFAPQSPPAPIGDANEQKVLSPPSLFSGVNPTPGLFGTANPLTTSAPSSFFTSPTVATATPSNLFGGAPIASSTPSLFGAGVQVPSLFGAPPSTGGMFGSVGSIPNVFGAPANTQAPPTTNIFGGGATTQVSTPSIFGGAPAAQVTSAAPSVLPAYPAASNFSFATPQTTSAPPPSYGTATASLSMASGAGDGVKQGFGFGDGFLSSSSAPTEAPQTLFGSSPPVNNQYGGAYPFIMPGQEQQSSLFTTPIHTLQTTQTTAAAPGDYNFQQHSTSIPPQVQSNASVENSNQIFPSHALPADQFQIAPGFGGQQQVAAVSPIARPQSSTLVAAAESQKQQVSAPSPVPTVPVQEEVAEIDNSVFIAAIAEEMSHFEAGLKELKKRVNNINVQIGTEEEKRMLSCSVESMSEFVKDLDETTQGQVKEINLLRNITFEALAWLEEARSRQQQLKSPRYQQLQQSLDLDHSSSRRLSNIQHMVYYVDSQLSQVLAQLDCEWLQFQDKCKDPNRSRMEPRLEAVYRTLHAQNSIVTKQRGILADLVKRAQPISNHRLNLISNMSMLHVSNKGFDSELSRLAESLIQVKLGPRKREKLSSKKHEMLLNLLADNPITRIRAVRPTASTSILELPPIKSGGISSGTPIKSVSPVQKPPEVPVQSLFGQPKAPQVSLIPSKAPAASTFTFASSAPAVKAPPSVKQALTFSTPVTTAGQGFSGLTFGSANKTIQSIPKNLTAYYDDVTPPRSPEPETKQTEPDTTSTFGSFNFSMSSKNVEKVPVKPTDGDAFTIAKERSKFTLPKVKQPSDTLKTDLKQEDVPPVVSSDSIAPTVPSSALGSFTFAGPKSSSTNLFGGTAKPATTASNGSTMSGTMFGSLNFGSTDASKTSIFGGSPPGVSLFGKPKDKEPLLPKPTQSTTSTSVSTTTSTSQESSGEQEKSESKVWDLSKGPAVSSAFSFAQPNASTQGSVFGQLSSAASTFSFAKLGENVPPGTTTAFGSFSFQNKDNQSEVSKSVTEATEKASEAEVPSTVEEAVKTTAVSETPISLTPALQTTTTSTISSFSFAKLPPVVSPPDVAAVKAESTPSSTSFFGQPICSPTPFGQSGGSLFDKPVTSSASPSIFGGSASPKLPTYSVVTETESIPSTTSSDSSPAISSGSSVPTTTTSTYVVIETKSPTISSAPIAIPTTTSTNMFGVTITPISSPSASTASTITSTAPVVSDSKPLMTVPSTSNSSMTALTSLFGSTIAPSASSTSIFGGQSTGGTSLFGQASTVPPLTPIFRANVGASATTPVSTSSMFGQSASVFGQAPQTSGSVFGGGDTSNTTTATSAFGTSGGSMFGSSGPSLFGGSAAASSPSVFGQSSAQSPTLFGQAPTTSQSIFGQATSPSTASSPFGAKPSIFGQAQENTAQPFGTPSAFGQSSQSMFGQSSPGTFGSSGGSMFGGGSSVFGSSPSSGGPFQQQSPGGFGSPASSGGGMFSSNSGQSISQTGFGGTSIFQNKPGGFGGSPVFGGGTTGFGAAPAFGGAPAFSGVPSFGSPSKVFGSTSPTTNTGFGSVSPSQQSSTFENLATQNTISFGNLAQGQPQGFGAPQQPLFGSPQQSAPQAPSAFSGGGSSFGGSSFSSWR